MSDEKEQPQQGLPELSERDLGELMGRIHQMNLTLMHNEPLKLFLYKLNFAVMRTGSPVPRSICLSVPGITKEILQKLTKQNILKEWRIRNSKTGAIMAAYTLADNITFYGDELVEVAQAPAEGGDERGE